MGGGYGESVLFVEDVLHEHLSKVSLKELSCFGIGKS